MTFASQYDKPYRPQALGNWEFANKDTRSATSRSAGKTADGRTIPIVNERGHIVDGCKKVASAFVGEPKGIQTGYLPTSTVTLKTVQVAGCSENNYNPHCTQHCH
ncbi:Protein Flattop [Chlorella vulgaris]